MNRSQHCAIITMNADTGEFYWATEDCHATKPYMCEGGGMTYASCHQLSGFSSSFDPSSGEYQNLIILSRQWYIHTFNWLLLLSKTCYLFDILLFQDPGYCTSITTPIPTVTNNTVITYNASTTLLTLTCEEGYMFNDSSVRHVVPCHHCYTFTAMPTSTKDIPYCNSKISLLILLQLITKITIT